MTDVLLREEDAGVVRLTLNRPHAKNALTKALVVALCDAVEGLADNAAVRAVVLRGAGDAFCSGADLKAMMSPDGLANASEDLENYHRLIRAIARAPQPVIAAVDGAAVGFGCDLALACDMRWLSRRAYLQEKFVRIGLIPDGGGTLWLTRLIGPGRALQAMLCGDAIDATQAEHLGLANRVVVADELHADALAMARRLATGPPLAQRLIKEAVRASLGDLDAALAREKESQLRCLASADFREGVAAWMEKRAPRFEGR